MGTLGAVTLIAALDWNQHVAPRIGVRSWMVIRAKPKGYKSAMILRIGSSDLCVFEQVFILRQYSPATRIVEPKVIVDCGANVGYSALFFLKAFPGARLIALEPDAANAGVCRRNLGPYKGRVSLLEKALWRCVARLNVVESTRFKGGEWGVQVAVASDGTGSASVEAVDVATLMSTTGVEQIDLLKIDIERSESEVFRGDVDAWLPRVRNIAIELHDEDCRDAFYCALRDYTFVQEQCGEITFCLDLRPRVRV